MTELIYKKDLEKYAILFKKDELAVIAADNPKDDNFAYILAERVIKERHDIIRYLKENNGDTYGTVARDIQELARTVTV